MSFDVSLLSDPRVFAINRLAPHSDHRWFASATELNSGVSSYEQSLDGTWKFACAANPSEVPAGFESPSYDTSTWDDIPVPAHIQLEGYDRPQYVNTQYPWDGQQDVQPPNAPTQFNPTACYVKEFTLEREPQPGERVTVTFDGAESAIAMWLNGQFIGYAEDSFTPSEFDITEALLPGSNKLAAQVFKWTSASWLEDQDFFRFSGIFRPVTLRTYPVAHVRDLRVGVTLSDDLAEAVVTLTVDIQGAGEVTATFDGHALTQIDDQHFTTTVSNPHLWSAEDPHLYDLQIQVHAADSPENDSSSITEHILQKVGIRRFGIEDGLLKINGQRVVFFGVNRHEFGENGRVMTREQTERDLIALKQAGLNAIRTSHYPNSSFFYELADRYGFYVIDEMNLETHGIWDGIRSYGSTFEDSIPGDDPQWLPAVLDRAANMYERDKNHPSIVIWSPGNESYGGKDLLEVTDYLRRVDSRPVQYEGVFWDPRYPETTDIRSEMYTSAADVEEYLKENRDKPFILCEFAHSMGNSFGAVDRYTDLAYREPLFQGGFIWDFADQALLLTDRYGNDFFGYGGDSGEAPHDAEFCGNGIFFADHCPTPRMQEVKYLYQGIRANVDRDSVSVWNRYNFTNTSAFECQVSVSREGEVLESAPIITSVAPGQTATYDLPVSIPQTPGEYTVDVSFRLPEATGWAEAGHEVAHEQTVIHVKGIQTGDAEVGKVVTPAEETSPVPAPEIIRGIHNFGVKGPDFSISFSRIFGGIQSYEYKGGGSLLKGSPMPNFWHAPTSNERGWGGPFEDGQWLLASRYAKVKTAPETAANPETPAAAETPAAPHNPSLEVRGNQAVITYVYTLPTTPQSEASVEYAVGGDGKVDVTLTLLPGADLGDLPEFGMLFKADADLDQLTFYGEGPDESYVDRRMGARLGVYKQRVSDQLTPYLYPQEAGNHTGVRWAEVTDKDGHGLCFSAGTPMEFSALHWSPFEVENAAHHHELPPIHNTFIRPALARRGVAGDDTWGARPHKEFVIPARPMTFMFSFQGVG